MDVAPPTSDRRSVGTAWAVALVAAGVALASFAVGSIDVRRRMPDAEQADALTGIPVTAWVWMAAALTVPLWSWSARRLPIASRRWLVGSLSHVALALMTAYLTTIIVWMIHQGGFSLPPVSPEMIGAWSLPFWLVIVAFHLVEARRRVRGREMETVRLRAQLAESRHQLLSAKLHPHFLFNTLQAISTLLHRDPSSADRMLGSLSDLLREFLTREPRARHSLGDELGLLDRYMEISAMRIGDRLTFRKQVEQAVESLLVPVLVLQPLAENAIEHGLACSVGPGCVTVFAHRDGASLCFGVTDDGPGLPSGRELVEGVGLGTTRSRLAELYGDQADLALMPVEPHGLRVQIRIPINGNDEAPR